MLGIKSFRLNVESDPILRDLISEEQVKAKFEIRLRQVGVRIDSNSDHMISLHISAKSGSDSRAIILLVSVGVSEKVSVFRAGKCYQLGAQFWNREMYGYCFPANATQYLFSAIEQLSDLFGNDFLSVNQ